tara:strand:- start:3084 stop:4382 length:1299 start_codon:yes stop_codon:yes gene_type:complete
VGRLGSLPPARRENSGSSAAKAVATLAVLAVLTQRLALPSTSLPLLLAPYVATVAWLVISRRLGVRKNAAVFTAAAGIALVVSALGWFPVGPNDATLRWLVVLLVLWIPFLFASHGSGVTARVVHATTITLGVGAVGAIVQFGVQLFGGPFIDPIYLLPNQYLLDGYLHTAPIADTGLLSSILRSNGLFFIEPSFASQYFALGALLTLRRHPAWTAVFVLALLTTGSGTGVIALGVGLLGVIIQSSIRTKVAVLAIMASAALLAAQSGYMSVLFARSEEFSTTGTSGSIRFVAPLEHTRAFIESFALSAVTGFSPGNAGRTYQWESSVVNYTMPAQLVIEYGLVFAVLFILGLCVVTLRSGLELSVRLLLLVMIFFLSGTLYQTFTTVTLWALVTGGPRSAESADFRSSARSWVPQRSVDPIVRAAGLRRRL